MERSVWRLPLRVLEAFHFGSSLVGGLAIAATNGLGMPLAWLEESVFGSYLVPGLILALVVGGTQAVAFLLAARHRPLALAASAVAGFTMIGFIYVQVAVLAVYTLLQSFFFATGVLQVVLVLLCLGVLRRPETDARD